MKKISLFLACAAMLSFASCKDDTEPRLDTTPTEFYLNTPAMANQYVIMVEGETVDLPCAAQPNYGFSVVTNYAVQVSLSNKFTRNVTTEGAGAFVPAEGDYVELRNPQTQSFIKVVDLDLTRAICKLLPYTDEATGEKKGMTLDTPYLQQALDENYGAGTEYIPVYFRVRAYVPQAEEMTSIISSNVVCYQRIKPFFSLAVPNKIYMTSVWNIHNSNDWVVPSPANIPDDKEADYPQPQNKLWVLSELSSEIDSQLYKASFWLVDEDGDDTFRFYQIPPAAGWGKDGSLGGKEEDFGAADLSLEDGVANGSVIVNGQGNWNLKNAAGAFQVGWYDFVVDLNLKTIKVTKVDVPTYETTYTPAQ